MFPHDRDDVQRKEEWDVVFTCISVQMHLNCQGILTVHLMGLYAVNLSMFSNDHKAAAEYTLITSSCVCVCLSLSKDNTAEDLHKKYWSLSSSRTFQLLYNDNDSINMALSFHDLIMYMYRFLLST